MDESARVQLCGTFVVELGAGGSTTCFQDVRAGCSSLTSHFLGCSPSLEAR